MKCRIEQLLFQVVGELPKGRQRLLKVSQDKTVLKSSFVEESPTRSYQWPEPLQFTCPESSTVCVEILPQEEEGELPEAVLAAVLEGEFKINAFDKGNHSKTIDIRDQQYKPVGKLSFKLTVIG